MIDKFISWALFLVCCFYGIYIVSLVIWINWRRDQLRKEMKRIGAATNE